MERQWDMEVVRLQIVPSFWHHSESTVSRMLSCHHMNSITGRTSDMNICTSTTWTQSLGGLLTRAFVLPPFRLNRWEDARPTTKRTQSLGGPFVNHSSGHVIKPLLISHPLRTSVTMIKKCRPIPVHLVPCSFHTVPWSLHHLQNRAHKTNKKRTWSLTSIMHKLCITLSSLSYTHPSHSALTASLIWAVKCWL